MNPNVLFYLIHFKNINIKLLHQYELKFYSINLIFVFTFAKNYSKCIEVIIAANSTPHISIKK